MEQYYLCQIKKETTEDKKINKQSSQPLIDLNLRKLGDNICFSGTKELVDCEINVKPSEIDDSFDFTSEEKNFDKVFSLNSFKIENFDTKDCDTNYSKVDTWNGDKVYPGGNGNMQSSNTIISPSSLCNDNVCNNHTYDVSEQFKTGDTNESMVKLVKCQRQCDNNEQSSLLPTLSKKILPWPLGPWEDGPRRSAFLPYKAKNVAIIDFFKPTTVLTNLQRGNMQAKTPQLDATHFTWHIKAGRGELRLEDIVHGPDINEKDEHGMTALMWSSAYGQTVTVQRLLKKGSDPNIRRDNGQSALHLAAFGGHHEIIKLLIFHGANVNALDDKRNTPLMFAVYQDHVHAVHELLFAHADPTILNFNDVMPYKLAVENDCNQARIVIENHLINLLTSSINA